MIEREIIGTPIDVIHDFDVLSNKVKLGLAVFFICVSKGHRRTNKYPMAQGLIEYNEG